LRKGLDKSTDLPIPGQISAAPPVPDSAVPRQLTFC
jgi:hypothetical protein